LHPTRADFYALTSQRRHKDHSLVELSCKDSIWLT
jgi:hypothetical protein